MQGAPLISYAQNREDVVLWRALREVAAGRYAEIGVRGPQSRSMTRVFSERGWNGLVIAAEDDEAAAWREARPRDSVETAHTPDELAAAVHRAAQQSSVLGDLHVLVVDASGPALDAVLADERLRQLSPWVLVTTGTATPDAIRDAGYELCLFDGVSRFYVSGERPQLRAALSYPACSRDAFTDLRQRELEGEVSALEAAVEAAREANLAEMLRWRHAAVSAWATTAAARSLPTSTEEVHRLRSALLAAQQDSAAVRQTLSWRVTKPLRAVRSAGRRT